MRMLETQKKGKKKGPSIDETPSVVFQHTGFHPHDLILSPFGIGIMMCRLLSCMRLCNVSREPHDAIMQTKLLIIQCQVDM